MFVVPPSPQTVSLYCVDGSVTIFSSRRSALRQLGLPWISEHVGREFCIYLSSCIGLHGERVPHYLGARYILRDHMGRPLVSKDFQNLERAARKTPRWSRRHAATEQYPGWGPVPFTRKWRGGGHYFRRVRHMNARKQLVVVEEGEPAPRARLANRPSDWDDRPISAREIRNWKRYRKHQWKETRA